jgi:hypothetical protein
MRRAVRRIKRFQRKRYAGYLLALTAAVFARGQEPDQEEPRWMSLHWTDAYLTVNSEYEQESSGSSQSQNFESRRIYIAPAIGIGAMGSIYHPDLLTYSLRAEPGYVYQQIGSPGNMSSQNSILQSYNFTGTLLQLKPYSTELFANASHDIQEYDFFNSVVADQQTWGVSSGYRTGPAPTTISYQNSHQDISGLTANSIYDQSTVNLHSHSDRNNANSSDLTWQYGSFSQTSGQDGGTEVDNNSYHQVVATDSEHFGKATLNSTVTYSDLEASQSPSETVGPTLDLRVQHTDNFQSNYGYAFTHYDDDVSELNQHFLHAGVQHHLYESLTSTFDVHGSQSQNSSSGSELDAKSGGVLGGLNYTKRIGHWGRFTLGNTFEYDLTDQTSTGGTISVPQESHTTTAATPQFRLTQPREIDIVSVTSDAAHGFVPLLEGADYSVDKTVDPWQVTVNFASLNIQHLESSGSVTVLITYDAVANPSGNYTTTSDQLSARLDLFEGMLGIYSQLQWTENSTDVAGFVLENLTEWQSGVDFQWKGLRLDAKYLDRESSLYTYNSKTLSESYTIKVDGASRIGVDLRQQWSEYPEQNQSAQYQDYLIHYEWRELLLHITWTVEGGLQRQHGLGLNQDLITARTRLEWNMGKLKSSLGYDYQNQDFNGETRIRNFAYLRLRRDF